MVQKKDLRRFISVYHKKLDRVPIVVWHNLPDLQGLSIHDAYTCWSRITKNYTNLSFVNWIDSRQNEYEAFTQEQYEKLT